jgi:proton glutamate symport protein
MDMARTMVNLVGNCLATAVMARWEGELAVDTPAAPAAPARAAVAAASPEA